MKLKIFSFFLLWVNFLFGQCPERKLLEGRIIYLRDSSNQKPQEKLNELLAFENEIKNCDYKADSTHAFLLKRIGVTYYTLGEYVQAIKFTLQAIDMISSNSGKAFINFNEIINDYYNLSFYYESLGRLSDKNRAIDSAIIIAVKLKLVSKDNLDLLAERTMDLLNIGDYQRCNNYAEMGAVATRDYRGIDSIDFTLYFLTIKVNVALKQYKNYNEAESILLKKLNEYAKAKIYSKLAATYELLAEIQTRKANYTLALEYFNKSFEYFEKDGYFKGCAQTLNNEALYLYFGALHDKKKAIDCYKKALVYSAKSKRSGVNEKYETLNLLTNTADVYVEKRAFDSAFFYFQKAFNEIKIGFSENNLLNDPLNTFYTQNESISHLIFLVIDKADAYLQQYKYTKNQGSIKEALRIYKIADQFLDKIKSEHSEMQSKLFWRSDTRRLYEHAIEACYIVNNTADAFYFFEKSRAVLLNDQLNEQRFTAQEDILQQLQLKKNILRDEMEADTANTTSPRYAELQNALIINKLELEKIQKAIKANNPLYYQSFLDSSFITLKDVRQNILQDHQALIELFTGDSAVYTLVITPEKNYITQVNKADFDATLNTYITHISNLDLLNRKFEIFKTASHHLYQLLFANIPIPTGRIIISPDGRNFPFEALIASEQNEKLSYFLYNHTVSYTYSARYLLNQFNTNSPNTAKDFMGMAPVNYPVNFSLASLPGSINSLQQLQPYFSNANILTGNNASRNNFLQNFSNYKIIQLYTHATDSSNNGEPAIYFADSVLNLSELIPENKPVTDLIVLSACKTGSGRVYQGEGVFSFNRAFAALGIPASVNNLWSADNASTYRLTELFYKYLAEGLPTDVALQKAKIEFIQSSGSKENELPYFWAATVLAGKTNTIEFNKPFPWTVLLIAIPIAGIALWKGKKLLKTKKV